MNRYVIAIILVLGVPLALVTKNFADSNNADQDLGVQYTTSGTPEFMDIAVPKAEQGAYPSIVYIHGGGWNGGSRTGRPRELSQFVDHGYVICSIDYRLAADAPCPAQIEDCKCSIRFLRANAAKYHADPKHIGVWGSSGEGILLPYLAPREV